MQTDEEKLVVVGIAALFRAAAIAGGNSEGPQNNQEAIDRAQKFVSACKADGLWPERSSDKR